jgi:integrase
VHNHSPGGGSPKLGLFQPDSEVSGNPAQASSQEEPPHYDRAIALTPGTLGWLAERYRARLMARVVAGDYSKTRLPLTMRYVDSFLDFLALDGQGVQVRVGSVAIEDARQLFLSDWLDANLQNWRTGSTRGDALGAVVGCYNWAEEVGLISQNPFRRPRDLKLPRQHRRAMRLEHYRAIYRAARKCAGSKEFRLIFFSAWNAGVRLIEFRQLEPREIDWESGVGHIPANKHKTGKTTGEARHFAVGPHLLAVLNFLKDRMDPGQKYLFVTQKGRQWSKDNLGQQYARYRRLAGVPSAIKMCAVRHGYALRMLVDGQTSAKAVADQLGHKSTQMVDSIYGAETRYEGAMLRELAAKAERGHKRPDLMQRKSKAKPVYDTPLFGAADEG